MVNWLCTECAAIRLLAVTGREAGSWNITLAFLWRPQSASCSCFFWTMCRMWLIPPDFPCWTSQWKDDVIFRNLFQRPFNPGSHIFRHTHLHRPSKMKMYIGSSVVPLLLAGSSSLWSACWMRGAGFSTYNMSTLVSPTGTLSVRTRMYFVWVTITPLSRLGINHIFLPTASL